MKRLFLIFFASASFVTRTVASDDGFTFECKRVRPSEMIRALRSLSTFGVSFKEEDRKVIVTGGDASLYERVKELMSVIDAPPTRVPLRFIKLRFADATHVAGVISKAFAPGSENEEIPLQAVPNTRTNEVFLMGTVQEIQAAEALVGLLDRSRIQAWRGCGEACF